MSLTDREIQNLKDLIPRVAELENGLAAADAYAKTLVVAKELASIHGSRLIGHHKYLGHAHSVETMLAHNTLHWLLDGGVITDAGGLNITWTAGTVFDATNNMGEIFNARTSNQALTDDAVNYIYKASGNKTLQVGVVHPDWGAGEIEIAHAHCANGDIWGLHQEEHPGHALTDTLHALGEVIPSAVVSGGLIISEDADVTNAFDVIQSAGTFYKQMHEEIPVVQIVSRTTNMYRWYRDGAGTDYTNDTNASIDVTQYDNGGTLTAIPSNKWVRSVFFTDGSKIHWVYPIAAHTNVASAISAADPALPTGLGHFPKTTAVIYQEGATAFPAAGSDLWIDVRPVLGAGGTGGSITDHGELGGLADKDHSAYLENTGDQMDGQLIVDETETEALLVRKNADGGDVLIVDTTNDEIELRAHSKIYQPADSEGLVVYGYDDVVGNFFQAQVTSTGAAEMVGNAAMLVRSSNGLCAIRSANNSIYLDLGDAVGARSIIIRDSGFATVATINSNGEATFQGKQIIDATDTEALLIRKNADGGDILIVDTTNSDVNLKQLTFIDGGSSVDIVRDEDDMATDDVNALATQQSIKKYVDDNAGVTKIATGAYTGDDTTSQAITGLGFAPIMVYIQQQATTDGGALQCCWTTDTIMDDIAGGNGTVVYVTATGNLTAKDNFITSLDADGFTVSDDGINNFPNQLNIVNNWYAHG